MRRTLDELPKSLDETYERVLREIKKPNMDNALRLLQCLVVATRPLRVEELGEVLAVDFDVGEGIPTLNTGWRWEDQEQALLSSCSSLISIVHGNGGDNEVDEDDKDNEDNQNENDSNDHNHDNALVQFSHFSVKEFLTSHRLATPIRDVSRYYIGLEPAHTIMAQACLSILLRSDLRIDHDGIRNNSPLTKYAAAHWVTHAQFKNVSSYLRQPMEILFDQDRPYFAAWLELHDIDSAPHSGSDTTFYQFTPNQIHTQSKITRVSPILCSAVWIPRYRRAPRCQGSTAGEYLWRLLRDSSYSCTGKETLPTGTATPSLWLFCRSQWVFGAYSTAFRCLLRRSRDDADIGRVQGRH